MIARAGIASRRRAEDLITEGKVKVNGEIIRVPQHPVLLSSAEKVHIETLQFITCQIAAVSRDLPRSVANGTLQVIW